jgi:phospholipid/cholesterol/gamma-HCH transport system substrate-binding protein
MLNQQTGSIAQSMNHVNSFTKNLSSNNEKISNTLDDLSKTTNNLSKADIEGTISNFKAAVTHLNELLVKVNSQDGSLGKLINDKALYNNLNNTIRSANTLVDDLRVHPKRYVSISVFGKKDKTAPIMAPLNDSIKTSN